MYVLQFLLLLAAVALANRLKTASIRAIPRSHDRPLLYAFVLVTPVLAIGVMFARLHWHILTEEDGFFWDHNLAFHITVWLGTAITVVALAFSTVQGIVAAVLVRRYRRVTDPGLLGLASQVAAGLGVRCPTLRICESSRPVALSGGGLGAGRYVLLSSWMVSNLDEEEMEAVLAHEMAHIGHRDQLMVWLGLLLRNTAFYLPASRKAWSRLLVHTEVARDRQAVEMTGRPLVLASALLKSAAQDLDTRARSNWFLGRGLAANSLGEHALGERVEILTGGTLTTPGRGSSSSGRLVMAPLILTIALEAVILAFLAPYVCCAWG
ncbi:MAG: M56 family metallopeptidase [Dehalococcoidia bacterium]